MASIRELEVFVPEYRKSWEDLTFAFAALKELILVEQAEDKRTALVKPVVTMLQWGTTRKFPLPDNLSGLRYVWGEAPLAEMIVLTSGRIHELYRNMYNPVSAISDFHRALSYMVDYGNFRGWDFEQNIKTALLNNSGG